MGKVFYGPDIWKTDNELEENPNNSGIIGRSPVQPDIDCLDFENCELVKINGECNPNCPYRRKPKKPCQHINQNIIGIIFRDNKMIQTTNSTHMTHFILMCADCGIFIKLGKRR